MYFDTIYHRTKLFSSAKATPVALTFLGISRPSMKPGEGSMSLRFKIR